METKTCTKCKEDKSLTSFHKCTAYKDGLNYTCKTCTNEEHNKWVSENRLKFKGYGSKWVKKNSEKIHKREAKYRKNNSEKIRKKQCVWEKDQAERITDGYVSHLLKTPLNDIPVEIIEAKRQIIQINRLIKQKQT